MASDPQGDRNYRDALGAAHERIARLEQENASLRAAPSSANAKPRPTPQVRWGSALVGFLVVMIATATFVYFFAANAPPPSQTVTAPAPP